MSNAVILFSGQGAQNVGMGKDLAENYPVAKALFAEADVALGFSLSEIMFEGPADELMKTSRCQPALYLHGLACLAVLRERVPSFTPVAAAGLSLGEFTAHAAAGTFRFADGLKVVELRGQFMEEACDATKGAMAAMIGGTPEAVKALAAECDVDVANFNAPGQIVVSGSEEGVDKAVAGAKAAGIKMAKKLNVAGAYHSRLMQTAQDKLAGVLYGTAVNESNIPVVSNFKGGIVNGADEIRETLEKQVTGSVRWVECIEALIAEGHTTFIELGPGRLIAGMMKRINKEATVICVEDIASLDAAVVALS
jgi:[acyl-carrier-protein] S-malonyltransferase